MLGRNAIYTQKLDKQIVSNAYEIKKNVIDVFIKKPLDLIQNENV